MNKNIVWFYFLKIIGMDYWTNYWTFDESNLPKENKFEFGDRVKYHNEWSNYDNCEWVVLEQHYHRCYRDYETKVNIKLQQWWYTDVRMWWSNLKKLQGGE